MLANVLSGRIWIILALLLIVFPYVNANTECVWATGCLLCKKNQTAVVNSIVELWDLDSPQNFNIKNPVDPDDKVTFTIVEQKDVTDTCGLFNMEGCASDFDWLPGVKNRPEFYIRVFHRCNTDDGEYVTVKPIFRVYAPKTYDYHVNHPIELDK